MMLRRAALAGLTLALLLCSRGASADDPTESEAVAREDVEALVREGVAMRKEGREKEALALFERAAELAPTPRITAQRGLAEKSLRRYVDAEAHLREALAAEGDPWINKNRAAIERAVTLVAKQLAWLTVTTSVERGAIAVNGAEVATLPLDGPLRILAGDAVVMLRAKGYAPVRREVTVPAGGKLELIIEPRPLPADPKPPPTPSPEEPPVKASPPSAEETTTNADPTPSWIPWIVTAATVGAAGAGVGIGLAVRTADLIETRDALCPDPECPTEEGQAVDQELRRVAIGSTVGFIVGGVGTATALLLWLLEPDDEPPVTTTVDPTGFALNYRVVF